jgi:hypothetical protein
LGLANRDPAVCLTTADLWEALVADAARGPWPGPVTTLYGVIKGEEPSLQEFEAIKRVWRQEHARYLASPEYLAEKAKKEKAAQEVKATEALSTAMAMEVAAAVAAHTELVAGDRPDPQTQIARLRTLLGRDATADAAAVRGTIETLKVTELVRELEDSFGERVGGKAPTVAKKKADLLARLRHVATAELTKLEGTAAAPSAAAAPPVGFNIAVPPDLQLTADRVIRFTLAGRTYSAKVPEGVAPGDKFYAPMSSVHEL